MEFCMERDLPAEVLKLYRREREIAEIVYANGLATANDVQAALSDPLTNAAIRSMLNRLVRKGILSRRPKDDGVEYVYYPVVTHEVSQERALRELAEDFFGGSLEEAAVVVMNLARRSERRHTQGLSS
jgi:predicted transcriptional regulator